MYTVVHMLQTKIAVSRVYCYIICRFFIYIGIDFVKVIGHT